MVPHRLSSVLSMTTIITLGKLADKTALRDRLSTIVDQLRTPMGNRVCAQITPLDASGTPGTSHSVRLKNFDKHGVTFYHRRPLCGRRALVSIESPQIGRFVAEVDLSWCRFSRRDNYTSGGRFVQLANKSA